MERGSDFQENPVPFHFASVPEPSSKTVAAVGCMAEGELMNPS